ncbi:MAG TPA: OmpA family protein [Flavobacterium sp.]|jgi:outer membrane protein OmpA-like peptidoglycan-associated protein
MKNIFLFIILTFSTINSAQNMGANSQQEKVEVFFDFDKFDLTDEAKEKIDISVNGRNLQVAKIYGYCDWKGSNAYNDSLSLKRVNEVYKYIRDKGIVVKEGYERKGFGEDFNQSKIQAENRKVLVILEQADKAEPIVNTGESFTDSMKKLKKGDKIRLKNINFQNNSAIIVPKSKQTLYELLCVMEENPKLRIEIQGHICCQPITDINDVSTARARAIFNFLVRNKINRKRLSFRGFGVTQPIHPIPEKNEEEADENRRVEILILDN